MFGGDFSERRAPTPYPALTGDLSPEREGKSTAVLIVPPDKPGCIESICWSSLSEHLIVACVEEFLLCARTNDPPFNPPSLASVDKSRIHLALAVGMNASPSMRAGLRVGEATWNWNHPTFAPIISFVRTVARIKI